MEIPEPRTNLHYQVVKETDFVAQGVGNYLKSFNSRYGMFNNNSERGNDSVVLLLFLQ